MTGAAGFLGREVARRLLARGYRVRALVRRRSLDLSSPELEVVAGDIRDAEFIQRAVAGCAAVVHLAAAMQDEADSEDVNVGGAHSIVAACRETGCHRVIVVSTQSVKIERKGTYARTKAAADAVFRASGLYVTVVLPSVVYGESLEGVFGTLHRFVTKLPVVPVLGTGRWRSAPVYVGDVADAIVACLREPASIGHSYDIAGPDTLSLDDLLDAIGKACGVGRRPKVHVPVPIALALARLLALVLQSPPLTQSNVLGSNQDTAIDIASTRQVLSWAPLPLDQGLRRVFPRDHAAENAMLWDEAGALGRYLVGADVHPEMRARYVEAHERLLPSTNDRVTAFARRHPASIPFLDAAAGLQGTRPVFRKRVLLMASILQAGPRYADQFLPAAQNRVATVFLLGVAGMWAATRAVIGTPLLLLLQRARTDDR